MTAACVGFYRLHAGRRLQASSTKSARAANRRVRALFDLEWCSYDRKLIGVGFPRKRQSTSGNNSGTVHIISTAPELMKLILSVLYVS